MLKLLIKIKSKTYLTSSYLWIVFSLILCVKTRLRVCLGFTYDENQQAFKDPLHVPVEPITRTGSKKIKEALNGLILTRDIPSLA